MMIDADRTYILREVQKLIDLNDELKDLEKEMDECPSGSYAEQQVKRLIEEQQAKIEELICGQLTEE